jgi:hypothetical protein
MAQEQQAIGIMKEKERAHTVNNIPECTFSRLFLLSILLTKQGDNKYLCYHDLYICFSPGRSFYAVSKITVR